MRLYETNSYLRMAEAEVVRCVGVEGGFEVVLDRTIFYPGGGGQPADSGKIGGVEAAGFRKEDDGEIVHVLPSPVSGRVALELEWETRYDHMQQHSAEHVIAATALRELGLKTLVFHISQDACDIEFEVDRLEEGTLVALEELVNRRVREALPVTVMFMEAEEVAKGGIRSRMLPEGLTGPLRVVEIAGLDRNTCGGTHVRNLSELQLIKLLGVQRLTRGCRVFFAAGGRALSRFNESLGRERELNQLLSCGPGDYSRVIGDVLANARDAERRLKGLGGRLAAEVGQRLAASPDPVVFYHCPEGDLDLLRAVGSELRDRKPDLAAVITVGQDHGYFMVVGPEAWVASTGPRVAELLKGKGGGRGGLFQGRAGTFGALPRLRELVDACVV